MSRSENIPPDSLRRHLFNTYDRAASRSLLLHDLLLESTIANAPDSELLSALKEYVQARHLSDIAYRAWQGAS